MKNLTKISVAASVVSVANVAKVGVASALIGAGLFLSACGGDSTSKAEKFVKEKYPDAQILTFDEAKKELQLVDDANTDESCFAKKSNAWDSRIYFFIKEQNDIKLVEVETDEDSGAIKASEKSIDRVIPFRTHCFKLDENGKPLYKK